VSGSYIGSYFTQVTTSDVNQCNFPLEAP